MLFDLKMLKQSTLNDFQTRRSSQHDPRPKCPHGYVHKTSCIECNPQHKCACGSGIHRSNCCEGLEAFKKRHAARMAKLQGKAQPPKPPPPAEGPKQTGKTYAKIVEPPQKMRKVVIANVEMLVEEGSTITIGGVPVKF